jgi:ABC-type bacteriocin/lantibiotic exporter with double-glycine peptidase domain
MDPDTLAISIPIVALMIPIVAIWAAHKRRMLQMQLDAQAQAQGTSSEQVESLRDEFLTLRESLTAHAMTMDESMKTLAARVTAIENRVQRTESNVQNIQSGP